MPRVDIYEQHAVAGSHRVRVTSAARTVVDRLKFRNRIGVGVAVEALRGYRRLFNARIDDPTPRGLTVILNWPALLR
jgi:hypothetical protein